MIEFWPARVFCEDFVKLPQSVFASIIGVINGANILTDGTILFGFFHPRAARVYLAGNFNDWQCPGHPGPKKEKFIEMELYRGFYYQPNIWLARIKPPELKSPIEYKFYLFKIETAVALQNKGL
jgi:hypothetical protein